MNGKWKGLLAAAEAACVLLGATGCSTDAGEPCQGVMYRVYGGKNQMTILGSIHVGNQRMTRFGPALEAATEAADCFVFECDTDSREAREATAALMQGREPLKEALPPETYALLQEAAESGGVSMSSLDGLRPWAAASLLSTAAAAAELKTANVQAALDLGVEEQVQKRVKGRAVRYLETAEEQLSLLDGFSPALQTAMAESAAKQLLHPGAGSLSQWPEWWADGLTEPFAEVYREENSFADPALTEEYHQALIEGRNRRMAQELAKLLEEGEERNYFVTVGLLHLALPEDSVLMRLEELGYRTERVGEEP